MTDNINQRQPEQLDNSVVDSVSSIDSVQLLRELSSAPSAAANSDRTTSASEKGSSTLPPFSIYGLKDTDAGPAPEKGTDAGNDPRKTIINNEGNLLGEKKGITDADNPGKKVIEYPQTDRVPGAPPASTDGVPAAPPAPADSDDYGKKAKPQDDAPSVAPPSTDGVPATAPAPADGGKFEKENPDGDRTRPPEDLDPESLLMRQIKKDHQEIDSDIKALGPEKAAEWQAMQANKDGTYTNQQLDWLRSNTGEQTQNVAQRMNSQMQQLHSLGRPHHSGGDKKEASDDAEE